MGGESRLHCDQEGMGKVVGGGREVGGEVGGEGGGGGVLYHFRNHSGWK